MMQKNANNTKTYKTMQENTNKFNLKKYAKIIQKKQTFRQIYSNIHQTYIKYKSNIYQIKGVS